jgi:hypothetical protein
VILSCWCRWALEDQEDEQRYEAEEAAAAQGRKGSHQKQQPAQHQEEKWLRRNVLFNPSIR